MKDIEAITLEDCHDFYRTYYAPNNATVVVVGDVQTGDVLKLVESHYGHLPAQPVPTGGVASEIAQQGAPIELSLDTAAERLVVAYPAPSMRDTEYNTAEVLLEVLLNSESARLTKKLVLDLELATSASGWISGFRHPGLFHVDVNLRPGIRAEQALEIIDAEIVTLLEEGVTERELLKARSKLEAEEVKQLLSAGSIAYNLGYYETTCDDFRSFFRVVEEIRDVGAGEVLALATTLLKEESRTTVFGRVASGGEAS
jgi:zinc protease